MPSRTYFDDPELQAQCNRLLAVFRELVVVRELDQTGQLPDEWVERKRKLEKECCRLMDQLSPTFEKWIRVCIVDYRNMLWTARSLDEADVVNEVLIRMWKSPPTQNTHENGVASLRTWFKTVTFRFLVDEYMTNTVPKDVEQTDSPEASANSSAATKGTRTPRETSIMNIFYLSDNNSTHDDEFKNIIFDNFDYFFHEVWPHIMPPELYEVLNFDYEYFQKGKTRCAEEAAKILGITVDNYYKRRERYRLKLLEWFLDFTKNL